MKTILALIIVAIISICEPIYAYTMTDADYFAEVNKMRNLKDPKYIDIISFCENFIGKSQNISDVTHAKSLAVIGESYGKLGDNEKGIDYCNNSLKIKETAFCYIQIANIYLSQKKYNDVITSLKKAYAISEDQKLSETIKKHIINIVNKYIAVQAKELYECFEANEVSAEDKYKDKDIYIKGIIASITTNASGNPVVALRTGKNTFSKVHCIFPKDARSLVGKLKKGESVIINGNCSGMSLGEIFITNCNIE